MKEHPIIFGADMIKAILDGRKTMTRRTYGLDKINKEPDAWEFKRLNVGAIALFWRTNIMEEDIALCKCPYGQVGDQLWVRETFDYIFGDEGDYLIYKADDASLSWFNEWKREGSKITWKPSIHMPRWASRITLQITGLRVERLHEITEEDAKAEGCISNAVLVDTPYGKDYEGFYARDRFVRLWDSLNAKRGYGWDVNPWCWAIKFGAMGVRLK